MTTSDRRDPHIFPHYSDHELDVRQRLGDLLASTPIPPAELADNLALYLRREQVADLLSMDALYRMILDLPGVIMEFGVLRGRHLGAFTALRGVYEPYNALRRIVGFDTFTGFPDVAEVDRVSPSAVVGRFAMADDYPEHLRAVLAAHESGEYARHITERTVVVQGDVRETLPRYLEENRQTVIALAYFDLDVYPPTREVLQLVRPHLTRGSVLAFDEIDHIKWPGENLALRETFGLDCGALRIFPGRSGPSYLRWD